MLPRFMFFIMKNKLHFLLVFFSVLFFIPLVLQAQVNDAGLWTSISLEKKLTKKWSLHFSEELRFNENISELGTAYSELTGEFRLNKILSISAGYRFILKRQVDDFYSTRHRYLVNVNVKNKFGTVSSNFRARFQSEYTDINSSDDGIVPVNYLRTKLSLKYNTSKKYIPYISGETFFHLNGPEGVLMDALRIGAGVEYEFSKRSSIEIGYLIDREIQVNDPLTGYIILAGWNYILK